MWGVCGGVKDVWVWVCVGVGGMHLLKYMTCSLRLPSLSSPPREVTERRWDPDLKLWVFKLSSLSVVQQTLEEAGCEVNVPSARIMDALAADHMRNITQDDIDADEVRVRSEGNLKEGLFDSCLIAKIPCNVSHSCQQSVTDIPVLTS